MEVKKYASYADIERDLEILKIEKEISYQKLILSFQKTKDSITPETIVSGFLEPYKEAIPNAIKSILKTAIPYLLSYFARRRNN